MQPTTTFAMEVESQPLLLEYDEKLGSFMYAQRPKKNSRLRSWAMAITTHSIVAVVVLFAVASFSKADCHRQKLCNAESRPELYCMFEAGRYA